MLPNDVYNELLALPEEYRNAIVIKAIAEEKISCDVVSRGYVEYIKNLKEAQSKDYMQLQIHITRAFLSPKKDICNNLAKCIRYLDEKKRINLTPSMENRLKKYEAEKDKQE